MTRRGFFTSVTYKGAIGTRTPSPDRELTVVVEIVPSDMFGTNRGKRTTGIMKQAIRRIEMPTSRQDRQR